MPEPSSAPDPSLPLAGILVAEFGDGFAVAYAGRLLAAFGATVVKVETPDGRGVVRTAGPILAGGCSAMHAYLDAGKLGVALDAVAAPAAGGQLRSTADIVLHFAEPGDAALSGQPAPIEVAISWLGQSGPWSGFLCDDFLAQHVSGMSFTSALRVPDTATHPPKAVPAHLAEMVAGLTAATAAVVALLGRDANGAGQTIDISVAESIVSFMRYETVIFSYGWGLPSRSRLARSPVAAPVFQQPTADGFVDMLIMQEDPWRALLEILGAPAWGHDELFATHPSRSEYWDALEPLLREELRKHSSNYLFTEGQRRGIAIAPVNTIGQAAAADQFAERDFFRPQDFGQGEVLVPGLPFLLGAPPTLAPAPGLGEHNRFVFSSILGCSEDELAALGVASD